MARETKTLTESVFPAPYAVFSRIVVFSTVLLIFIGATITTTGSGLAVPDWPLSFGKFNPAMIGGVYYEHGHRLVASGVGFLVLIGAIWAYSARLNKTISRLALLALGLVIFQGLLGGLTVLMRLPTLVSAAHGTVAQLFFCTTIALAWWTTSSFVNAEPSIHGAQGKNLRLASLTMTALVLLQLLVGATMRHMGAGYIIPDFPLSFGRWIPPLTSSLVAVNFLHRVLALTVLCMATLLVLRIYRYHRDCRPLPFLGGALITLVLCQGMLGALTVWSKLGFWQTCLHVTNGALVLGVSFSITLWALRLTRTVNDSKSEAPSQAARQIKDVSRKDWMELTKVRLVSMSVFTALCGYLVGAPETSWAGTIITIVGVGLLGAGSAMLNHVVEIETDARMNRTRNRPLPAGRVDVGLAERTGGVLATVGILVLGLWHPLAGILAFGAFVSYVLVYTPMKRYSVYCTVVGAVPGALPVLTGYVVGTGAIDIDGVILFTILFMWQLPHFISVAWLCKDDYERAGFPMVTVIDPGGGLASTQILVYCLALIPVSLAPTISGLTGPVYFFVALILGFVYLYAGAALCVKKTTAKAKQLLLTSVVYLPLLYGVMVAGV